MEKHYSHVVGLVSLLMIMVTIGYATDIEDNVTHLEYLQRTSNYRTIRRCDDCNSDAIDLSSYPVPFGEYYHDVVHVATNGLISFGKVFTFARTFQFTNESSPAIYTSFLAAPYWADIDNRVEGEIWYETHTGGQNSTASDSLLEEVSQFIRVQQNETMFEGSWMLVATWNETLPFSVANINISEQNTFQGIVITNGTKTYAVFTYRCDDIQWETSNTTVIGFNAGGTSYDNHPLSGTPDAVNIDCENSPQSIWNNIVYDVNPLGSNSSVRPLLGGSCKLAGYTECCTDFFCLGAPTQDCYCDSHCTALSDCCHDIEETCFRLDEPQANETFLVVASTFSIEHITIDGTQAGSLNTPTVFSRYIGVDYDYGRGYVYFSELLRGRIRRVGLNGSSPTIVYSATSRQNIEDLAVDWIANNIYWTDTLNRRLEVLDLDSNEMIELLRTDAHSAPRAIVVDPSTRYMYWSDWGEPAKIERASMDGNNREVLIDTDLVWPNGLAIDYQLQRLYWTDAFTDRIEYSSVDGTGREILLTGLDHPFAITISGDQIFWTDWGNATVYTAHKQSAISYESLYSNFFLFPNGIEAVDEDRQDTNITNYCEGNPCSHLCLLSASSPTNYTCACPEGFSLQEDGVNCSEIVNATVAPFQPGSCVAAGYTDCCQGGYCAGYSTTSVCFCEPDCVTFGDCCDDFYDICAIPTTPPLPGTYLEYLQRTSNHRVMPRCDDCNSDAIDLSAYLVPFGEYYHDVAHVATNGLILFGKAFVFSQTFLFSNESRRASFVAAPYWADIDNRVDGEIWYETHTAGQNSTASDSLLEEVSQFIRVQQNEAVFKGSWMLVATWNETLPFIIANESERNTFQGIVITNGTKTYAVFTYRCDDIQWETSNTTVIGFNAGGTSYDNHPLSGTPDAVNIDCENSPQSIWNNIVYDVNPLGSNSSATPPLRGSCKEAGFTECCNSLESDCLGAPTLDCFCDPTCHVLNDCCYDINEICTETFEVQGNETFLVVTTFFDIRQISLDGSTSGSIASDATFPFFLAVDYDYRQRYIYYSDLYLGHIRRTLFNGSSTQILATSSVKSIEDIAVDWIANNIYWTDTVNRRLEVLDIDSNAISELLRTDAHSAPRAIVVDPSTRYMYWSDWGEPAKIERASMDGNNREVLIDTDLVWPNGLAIDYQLQRLYWTDAFTDKIEYSSVDGTGREILLTAASGIDHPFGITISGDQIFYIEFGNTTVYTAHKQSAISVQPMFPETLLTRGIEAVDPNRQWTNITNYCEENPCSHLCLLSASSPMNYTCACPEGFSLQEDGANCREIVNYTTTAPFGPGSCAAAGFTSCCAGGYCAGYPPSCFCASDCIYFGDCCDDLPDICSLSTPDLAITNSTTTLPESTTQSATTTESETTFESATTTKEPTNNIISSASRISGGAIAGIILVSVLLFVVALMLLLGVVWAVMKVKRHKTYSIFESSRTDTPIGNELKPTLDSYEQQSEFVTDKVSYEANDEKLQFETKS